MDDTQDKETVEKPPTIRLTAGCAVAVGRSESPGETIQDSTDNEEEN